MPVVADPWRMEQVVTNYLTNALKYSPADCPVAVGIELGDQRVRVWVRDQGPGLPSRNRNRSGKASIGPRGSRCKAALASGWGWGYIFVARLSSVMRAVSASRALPGQGPRSGSPCPWPVLPMRTRNVEALADRRATDGCSREHQREVSAGCMIPNLMIPSSGDFGARLVEREAEYLVLLSCCAKSMGWLEARRITQSSWLLYGGQIGIVLLCHVRCCSIEHRVGPQALVEDMRSMSTMRVAPAAPLPIKPAHRVT